MNYVISGSDTYLVQQKTNELISSTNLDGDEMNLLFYDALTVQWDEFIQDAQCFPFFGDLKLMIMENCYFLTSEDSLNDRNAELLVDYMENPNHTTIVILTTNQKLDKRKNLVKKLSNCLKVIEIEPLKEDDFYKIVKNDLDKYKISIDHEAIKELYQRLPNNLLNWQNELQKLKNYPNLITKEVIVKIVSRNINDDIFKIVDAVLKQKSAEMLSITSDLWTLNTEPLSLVALLASNFHFIYKVSYYLKRQKKVDEIAKIMVAHPYRVKLAVESAKKIENDEILNILNNLAKLDYRFKNVTCDRRLEFELFLIKLVEK